MGFTRAQVTQLLQPINTNRVLRDGKGHSHVSQQDVLAHLIRIFGFGNFDTEIISVECVFETPRVNDETGKPNGRWDVCYRAAYRLIVKDENGVEVCHFEDGSTATAQNQSRGDAHDLAYKSALSLAKKRAAIPLGDQFGLSLYNKGQTSALVRGTLIIPEGEEAERDVQEGVEKQVSLGNDEIERDLDASPAAPRPSAPAANVNGEWVAGFEKRVAEASPDGLGKLRQEVLDKFKARALDSDTGNRLMDAVKERQKALEQPADGMPRNKDGSISRSQIPDEKLAEIGSMTREQMKEHNRLAKNTVANPKKAERSVGVDATDEIWMSGGVKS